LVGAAENVTLAPVQMVLPALDDMDTETGEIGITDMVTELEVSTSGFAQEEFEVMMQVTVSPSESPLVV
jgi:hypothetical protein